MNFLSLIAIASFVLVLNSACTSKPLTPEERFAKMSVVEHLDLAKSNIENHYYDSAKKHLAAITSVRSDNHQAVFGQDWIRHRRIASHGCGISRSQRRDKETDWLSAKQYQQVWLSTMPG